MVEKRIEDTFGERPTMGRPGPETAPEGPAWTWSEEDGERETVGRGVSAEETTLAGRYKVVRRLGEGGMGSVWLAEDLKLDGRRVALKMLPSMLAGRKAACRQVKREALMAMKLSHPNIATVRAFEEDEGNPFLVMDYIEGRGLDDILADKGTLPEADAVKLLGPVAEALDYAHAQGVVHRDVKPGNVVVRKDGRPYVLDFGIAREIQETVTRVTGKFTSGTLLYMSPEQLRGRAPKAAQDVYSFAAMAYECLSGHPPFYRGGVEDQIKNEPPEPLAAGVASKVLREGILAGLAKEPEGRPETCAGVLAGAGTRRPDGPGKVRTAGTTARPKVPPRQHPGGMENRPEPRPSPDPDAARAGRRDDTVFWRKVHMENLRDATGGEGAREMEVEVGWDDSGGPRNDEPGPARESGGIAGAGGGELRENRESGRRGREEKQMPGGAEQQPPGEEPAGKPVKHKGRLAWQLLLGAIIVRLVVRFVRVSSNVGWEGLRDSLMDPAGRVFWTVAVVAIVAIIVLAFRQKGK